MTRWDTEESRTERLNSRIKIKVQVDVGLHFYGWMQSFETPAHAFDELDGILRLYQTMKSVSDEIAELKRMRIHLRMKAYNTSYVRGRRAMLRALRDGEPIDVVESEKKP